MQVTELDDEDDEDEARLHAQYRLKQRLREKSRRDASRVSRQQPHQTDGEDEEEREARLTSLAHTAMPPSPTIRTRSLRPSPQTSTTESELPPLSARSPLCELSVLQKQRQRVVGDDAAEERCEDDDGDADMADGTAYRDGLGAATPCFRVAKRLQQPTAAQWSATGCLTSMQSPLSYLSSPAVSSTLSTASASPAVSVPSFTRSVSYRSPYSSLASPYCYSSSPLPSPLLSSPAALPSVLLQSPAADGSKQRAPDSSRPLAMFTRRPVS